MSQENTDNYENELRDTLRKSEQQLDTRTHAQLAAARRDAVEQKTATKGFDFGTPAWGSVAAAALIAVVLIRVTGPTTEPAADNNVYSTGISAPTADAMTTEQQIELYENLEMLEFFEALEFAEELNNAPSEERAS